MLPLYSGIEYVTVVMGELSGTEQYSRRCSQPPAKRRKNAALSRGQSKTKASKDQRNSPKKVRILVKSAAKRRKNAAHGASRGYGRTRTDKPRRGDRN